MKYCKYLWVVERLYNGFWYPQTEWIRDNRKGIREVKKILDGGNSGYKHRIVKYIHQEEVEYYYYLSST